jgi:hypothetical protein
MNASWASSACAISVGYSSHKRVEPSTSVSKKTIGRAISKEGTPETQRGGDTDY